MAKELLAKRPIIPERKIKVFISSICGDNGKYDRVRAEFASKVNDGESERYFILYQQQPYQ